MKAINKLYKFPLWGLGGFIALCLFTLIATSCAKNGENRSDDPIVGTWQMTSFGFEAPMTVEEMTGTIAGVGREMDDVRITFNADGTTSSSGTYIMDMTITIGEGSNTTSIPTNPTVLHGGTWKRNGNTLITNHSDNPLGPQEIAIISLDGAALHLGSTMPPPVPTPGLGNITADIRFTRIN